MFSMPAEVPARWRSSEKPLYGTVSPTGRIQGMNTGVPPSLLPTTQWGMCASHSCSSGLCRLPLDSSRLPLLWASWQRVTSWRGDWTRPEGGGQAAATCAVEGTSCEWTHATALPAKGVIIKGSDTPGMKIWVTAPTSGFGGESPVVTAWPGEAGDMHGFRSRPWAAWMAVA